MGCGFVALLGAIGLGLVWLQFSFLSGRALQTREALEKTLPTQADFTPWPDDVIPADRIERFLAVRRELQPRCEEFAGLRRGMNSMERRTREMQGMSEDQQKQELKALAGEGGSTLRRMLALTRDLPRYSIARNEALIRNEMGLGEYTWIYVMAYYAWLGHEPESFPVSKEETPRIFKDRVLGQVWAMAGRHVDELAALSASTPEDSDTGSSLSLRLAVWHGEMQSHAAAPDRVPFQGRLPERMAASLAPYRGRIEKLFCPETNELEIMRTEKGFLKYEHN